MTTPATETTTTEATPNPLEAAAAQVWGSDPEPEGTPAVETTISLAEPEPEKPASPPEKSASGRIAAAKRAEQRAEQQRVQLREQQRTQERKDAELKAREDELKLLEEDPARYFEVKKLGSKGIAAHLEKLANGSQPEKLTEKKLESVDERIAKLEAEIARRDEALRESQRRQQDIETNQQASKAFLEHVGAAADQYPNLTTEFTEEEAVQVAFAELTRVIGKNSDGQPVRMVDAYFAKHGELPGHDVIAEHLDGVAKARIEARSKSAWRKQGRAPSVSETAPSGEASRAPQVKGTSPRTLTSRDASSRASAPRERTPEEVDAECIRMLEAGIRKSG